RSTRRLAAQLLTLRLQALMPHAADVPEISVVLFRRPDGKLESYRIPWAKSGLLLTTVGRYTTPGGAGLSTTATAHFAGPSASDPPPPDETPAWLQLLARLQNCRIPDQAVNGFGSQTPVFAAS